jgi:hypothetical protein
MPTDKQITANRRNAQHSAGHELPAAQAEPYPAPQPEQTKTTSQPPASFRKSPQTTPESLDLGPVPPPPSAFQEAHA